MVTKWLLLIPVKVKHLLLIVVIVFAIAILYRFKMKPDDGNNTTKKLLYESWAKFVVKNWSYVELVSKDLNHLAAILHVYAEGLNFMK